MGCILSSTGLEDDLWAYQVDAYTIRRWLYVERMTTGTRQGHGSTQASASLFQANKKMAPPSRFLTSGSHAIVNVVNKRENCTRSGRQLGPSSSSSICVFEVWALQSFSMFTPDISFSPLNNNENIAAGINWAGYGSSSPGQILIFFKLKMASPAILF